MIFLVTVLDCVGVSFYPKREARVGDCRTGSAIDAAHTNCLVVQNPGSRDPMPAID